VKPHKAMISASFSPDAATAWQETALYCCECALCTLYSCPEDLDPFRMMVLSKRALLAKGIRPEKQDVTPHPMYPHRRTPTTMLVRRLGLEPYLAEHRYAEFTGAPAALEFPLTQHIGAPSVPVVKKGARVQAGTLLAEIPEKALGSRIFTSLAGRVSAVEPDRIFIEL